MNRGNVVILTSGVSIIADVAESIAETKPISINRIEIWDRLIGKKGKRTSLQRTNCYWYEYSSIYRLEKDGVPSVSQTTRMLSEKYFPSPALNRSRGYGNISDFTEKQPIRWRHKTYTQTLSRAVCKHCRRTYANKAISTLRSVVLGKKFGKTIDTLPLKAVNPIQITTSRRKRSHSVLLEKTLYQCLENLSKAVI